MRNVMDVLLLVAGGDDGVCEALMCIDVRRGPRAADGRQRKHAGQPDSYGRPRSRRVGLTYGAYDFTNPKPLADDMAAQATIRADILPYTHAFISWHCIGAKRHHCNSTTPAISIAYSQTG